MLRPLDVRQAQPAKQSDPLELLITSPEPESTPFVYPLRRPQNRVCGASHFCSSKGAEAGVPGFAVSGWFMLTVPGRTPRPVIERLHGELKSSLAAPEAKDQIVKLSLLPMETPSVEEMQSFVKSEIVRWAKIVQQAGIAGSE